MEAGTREREESIQPQRNETDRPATS